ncbi:hypothetical protein C4565_04990 [Candidatus Parcubacteria bacterium]|nr:MAG: hypothetical protein C4565_04990 [Candidatus Parcubacteria bacterium]
MSPDKHVIATGSLSVIPYLWDQPWEMTVGFVLGGILIDIDHMIDFAADCGFSLNIKQFFRYGTSGNNTYFICIFHTLEFIPLLLYFIIFSSQSHFFLGFLAGFLLHLTLDYLQLILKYHYKMHSFILYFLLFRIAFLFDRHRIDRIIR